jgi:hypothetical protein
MTLKQFFKKARKFKWKVNALGDVRCKRGYCPLGAVEGMRDPLPWPPDAAKNLGLRKSIANKIADAADMSFDLDYKKRRWLLKNLGI